MRAYASALDVSADPTDDAAAARSRRRSRNARRTAVVSLVVFLLVCGVAGGGWWYANKHGLVTAIINDLNGQTGTTTGEPGSDTENATKDDQTKMPGDDTSKGTDGDDKKDSPPPAEDPTKAKGYVWGLADGMWEMPTQGEPLDLKYIATGLKALVAIRPADIVKILRAKNSSIRKSPACWAIGYINSCPLPAAPPSTTSNWR